MASGKSCHSAISGTVSSLGEVHVAIAFVDAQSRSHLRKLLHFSFCVPPLLHLRLLVIQHNEVAPTHVEAGEMVNCCFSVVDVLKYDERCAACVRRISEADLADCTKFSKDVVHFLG